MDKELTEINPANLDGGTAVNTINRASVEAAQKAAAEEKEKKQDFYVDPLEQDKIMQEKLAKIEEEKAAEKSEEDDEINESTIHPDMSVTGYFSTGNTATKPSIMNRTASTSTLTFCFLFGIINGAFSLLYMALLISTGFSVHWFLSWAYAAIVVLSIVIMVNSIRSLNTQKANLKRNAMVGIVGASISFLPIITWIIHWLMSI